MDGRRIHTESLPREAKGEKKKQPGEWMRRNTSKLGPFVTIESLMNRENVSVWRG